MQKKVVLFESYPFFSGAQRVSLNFCKVLKENNLHVTLLLADDPQHIHRDMFGPFVDNVIVMKTNEKLTRYGNFNQWFNPVNFISTFFTGLLPFYKECYQIFKNNKFDYLYFCDPRGAVMMFFPSLFFKGVKICYLQGKNKLGAKLAKMLYLTVTDHLLCPSTDVLESLPNSSKKMVLHYGVDISQYGEINPLPVKDEIEKLLDNQDVKRLKMLFAGLIRPHKGVHHLINSMIKLKNTVSAHEMPVLFILGNPKNEIETKFMQHLKEVCDNEGVSKYIYWLGWKDNVLEWMKNCDYFIFPTIDKEECNFEGFDSVIESSEGSPVVLIESSLCGLYTIASKVTGVNETITNNHNGVMYNPNEKAGLFDKMLMVVKEKPQFIDFPTRELFSPKTFANKIMTLFK